MKRLLLIIVLLFNLTIADTMYIATSSSSGSWNTVKNSCVSSGGDYER